MTKVKQALDIMTKQNTLPHTASGWRIHCGVEVTELSTNKQHTLTGEVLTTDGCQLPRVYRVMTSSLNASCITKRWSLSGQSVALAWKHWPKESRLVVNCLRAHMISDMSATVGIRRFLARNKLLTLSEASVCVHPPIRHRDRAVH